MQLINMRKNWFDLQIALTIFLKNSNCEMKRNFTINKESSTKQSQEKPLGVYYTKAT